MTSKQRAYLKGLAMTMEPIFQVGKSSVTPEFTKAVDEALTARELIKLSVLQNCADDPREIAELHGGRIIAKSDDNKTQFIVTLPSKSKQEEGDSDEVHTHSGRASRRKSGRRKKVQRKKKK